MNQSEFSSFMREQFDTIRSMHLRKTAEYASKGDALSNFKELGQELDREPEDVLYVFLNKHLASIRNHIKALRQSPADRSVLEPVDGRIHDAILYLMLLHALFDERSRAQLQTNMVIKDVPLPATPKESDVPAYLRRPAAGISLEQLAMQRARAAHVPYGQSILGGPQNQAQSDPASQRPSHHESAGSEDGAGHAGETTGAATAHEQKRADRQPKAEEGEGP